jgi:uncharacterized protein (DUF1778 family)
MNKKRIQVYADPETKRRIELAAARRDIPVTQYCLEAIHQKLAEDDLLMRETVEIPIKQTKDEDLIANLRALREKILVSRGGKLISLDIVEQVREERDHGLLSMR